MVWGVVSRVMVMTSRVMVVRIGLGVDMSLVSRSLGCGASFLNLCI